MEPSQPLQSPSSVMQSSADSGGKGTVPIVEPPRWRRHGVGFNCSARNPCIRKPTELGFTSAQLNELHQQILFSKSIAARHPLPPQFAIPIHDGVSCIKYWAVDPEPNRCRRTDGKKWRCRNTVMPNEKYCEYHKHRGRQRSRKPVELPNEDTPSIITVSGNSNDSNETPLGPSLVTDNSSCSIGGHVSRKRDATAMLGCSPTSDLQGNGSGTGVEQQWRCKRNDGRRWQCSQDVLPNQEYCESHIDGVVTKSPADVAADSSKLINTNHPSVSVTPPSQRLDVYNSNTQLLIQSRREMELARQRLDEYNRNAQLLIQSRYEIERAREIRERERLKKLQEQEEQFIMSQNLSTMNPIQQRYWERKQAAIVARYEMEESRSLYEDYISEISSLNHELPPNN